jgi:hypothetical protein
MLAKAIRKYTTLAQSPISNSVDVINMVTNGMIIMDFVKK